MTVSLFSFVDLYSRQLTTASHLLTKGAEHAKANGVSEADLLGWRLIDDMATLRFQLTVVCNFAQAWPARVAGLPVPADVPDGVGVTELQGAIAGAKAWLAARTQDEFAGRDDVPLTFMIGTGMEPTLPSGQWLTVFATTNLYFHLSTAYGILRSKGVQIGKIDLFAGGL
jgi:hypothetical protein